MHRSGDRREREHEEQRHEYYGSEYRGSRGADWPRERNAARGYEETTYGEPRYGGPAQAGGYPRDVESEWRFGENREGQRGYGAPASGQSYTPRYGGSEDWQYGNWREYGRPGGYWTGRGRQGEYGQGSYGRQEHGRERGRIGFEGQSRSSSRRAWGNGPKGYVRSDERLKEEISDRLMASPEIDSSDIEVEVSGGEVTLKGSVCCRSDKFAAEQLAESVMGVKDVSNQLRLRSSMQGGGTTGSGSFGQSGQATSGSGTADPGDASRRGGSR